MPRVPATGEATEPLLPSPSLPASARDGFENAQEKEVSSPSPSSSSPPTEGEDGDDDEDEDDDGYRFPLWWFAVLASINIPNQVRLEQPSIIEFMCVTIYLV